MRHPPRALLAGGLGFAAALLVACGGGAGLLSTDQASSLNGTLGQVSAAVQAGQCGQAQRAATNLKNAVANLPASVNTTLQSNLNQGASTVAQLATNQCKTTTTTTTRSTTTSTATSSSTTSTPTTTTTRTAPPPTSSTPTTTPSGSGTTSTGPPSGGAGVGNGGGGPGTGGAGPGNGGGPGGGGPPGHGGPGAGQ
ncbi:MAG: hypothetical protein ACR2OB_09415 [Solirubrobacteraceae bacterium]